MASAPPAGQTVMREIDAGIPGLSTAPTLSAMSIGLGMWWRSSLSLAFLVKPAQGIRVKVGCWATHVAWHRSLCPVTWHTDHGAGDYPLVRSDGRLRDPARACDWQDMDSEMGVQMARFLRVAAALWPAYPDLVPFLGRRGAPPDLYAPRRVEYCEDYPVMVSESETRILNEYRIGSRGSVIASSVLCPRIIAPGSPGVEGAAFGGVSDYLARAQFGNDLSESVAKILPQAISRQENLYLEIGLTPASDMFRPSMETGPAFGFWSVSLHHGRAVTVRRASLVNSPSVDSEAMERAISFVAGVGLPVSARKASAV